MIEDPVLLGQDDRLRRFMWRNIYVLHWREVPTVETVEAVFSDVPRMKDEHAKGVVINLIEKPSPLPKLAVQQRMGAAFAATRSWNDVGVVVVYGGDSFAMTLLSAVQTVVQDISGASWQKMFKDTETMARWLETQVQNSAEELCALVKYCRGLED